MEEHKQIFREFLEEAISAESKARYGPAVSNYYKALTTLCSHLITTRLRRTPKNHSEVFFFLRTGFPEIYRLVDGVFTIYTDSYDRIMRKEDCARIKDVIKQVSKISGLDKEFEEVIKKI